MQISLRTPRAWQRHAHVTKSVLAVMGLIFIDQLTKVVAYSATPSAAAMIHQPGWNFGLAWHIHEPNAYSHFSALLVFGIIAFTCCLPIPTFAKVMWAAAGISNHIEMLARPGTVDFLACRVGGTMWVANVADLYYVLGIISIAAFLAHQVRTKKSWLEPVTA